MCMFCAAIPMTMAAGSAIAANQKEKERRAALQGEPRPAHRIPVRKATLVITGSLIVGSVVYHGVIMPRFGLIL
ncbi:MAG: hypothetical protein U0822_23785 [Anaerolineae bacterium]